MFPRKQTADQNLGGESKPYLLTLQVEPEPNPPVPEDLKKSQESLTLDFGRHWVPKAVDSSP
ncbi:MAG: hypothetical protein DWQ01_06635 [Planctomycetota bacterium]|nr:MAG: hypothetical protein DWQ01_06635 [Planctomycetota bacterium]